MFDEPVVIDAHKGHVNSVRFSPDLRFLVSAGMDGLIKLWHVGSWKIAATFWGHSNSANSLSFHPNGRLLATSSTDRTARLWCFPEGSTVCVVPGTSAATVSPDGKMIAFAPKSGVIALRRSAVAGICFYDGGRSALTSGYDGTLGLWRTDDWSGERINLEGTGTFAIAVDPSGAAAAVATDHRVRVYSLDSGSLVADAPLKPKGVYSVTWSRDGTWLAAATADGRLRVWRCRPS
jgi:WD40 repeat protein